MKIFLKNSSVVERNKNSRVIILKKHDSVKSGGGVTVLVLCTLSEDALYLYQVKCKYSNGSQSYLAETISTE